jgi:hypothetical protein
MCAPSLQTFSNKVWGNNKGKTKKVKVKSEERLTSEHFFTFAFYLLPFAFILSAHVGTAARVCVA